jgi:hypothetical protein
MSHKLSIGARLSSDDDIEAAFIVAKVFALEIDSETS